jgi:hypothetical protein
MRKSVNVIKQLLEDCSDQDRDEWKSHAQTVLGAVRASHPTKRGVNSAIAAAFFESGAMPGIAQQGWVRTSATQTGSPFGIVLEGNGRVVRVLIAILQLEAGKPRRQRSPARREDLYVVQVQKKLSRAPVMNLASRDARTQAAGLARAYSFGDFDILAVNVQPVTRRWTDFRYTLTEWLVPCREDAGLIATEQPVSLEPASMWTEHLPTCLEWSVNQTRRQAM